MASLFLCVNIPSGQRLKMTAFTLPIVYDKTYLVIPKPGTINTLGQQTKKVLMPFSNQLWCLSLGIILVAALLSVWFTDHSEEKRRAAARRNDRRMAMQPKTKTPKLIYLRLAMDSFIEKGLVRKVPVVWDTIPLYNLRIC